MTLVDTSVWIDFLNGQTTESTQALKVLMERGEVIGGDLILTEVMQGVRPGKDLERAGELFSLFDCVDLVGCAAALRAAAHYRTLRSGGVTIRKTIDVMIASYCIAHGMPLLFTDRDFLPLVASAGLQAAAGSSTQ